MQVKIGIEQLVILILKRKYLQLFYIITSR